MTINDQVIDFLATTDRLSDYCDDTTWIADEVNIILHDKDDDKLARIRDLYYQVFTRLAEFVEDNHDSTPTASWLYNEMVQEELMEEEDDTA